MDLYHLAAIRWAIRHNAPLAIIDRWWPSEYVYAGVYRGGSKFPYMRHLLNRIALRYGLLYCITHRTDRDVQANAHLISSKEREEMYASDEKIKQLHDWYVKLYQQNSHRRNWCAYNLDLQGGHLMATCSNLYNQARTQTYMEAPHFLEDYMDTRSIYSEVLK
jgi:DNA polymerase III alpha subunit (gram-positive type)